MLRCAQHQPERIKYKKVGFYKLLGKNLPPPLIYFVNQSGEDKRTKFLPLKILVFWLGKPPEEALGFWKDKPTKAVWTLYFVKCKHFFYFRAMEKWTQASLPITAILRQLRYSA